MVLCFNQPDDHADPDYSKLPDFHYLSWSETHTDDREPDDFQPRAQIMQLFEENKPVSGTLKP